MTSQEFIFSNKPSHRFTRHTVFWLLFTLHFFVQNLIVGGVNEALKPRSPLESLLVTIYYLPIYIFSTYLFVYWIIPKFLFHPRYTDFFISLTCLIAFNFFACYSSGRLYAHVRLHIPYDQMTFSINKYPAIVNGLWVSVTILAITGGIILSKKWYQRQRENEALAKQKISHEIQLVKTQLQPRFLFHSLNTIQKHIKSSSSVAPQLILQLSDLLSYTLYESEKEWVLLEKEMEIIRAYVELQKKSAGGRLTTLIETAGIITGKYITPLVLLSLIQKCFEILPEDNYNHSSFSLSISVRENLLKYYSLYNSSYNSLARTIDIKKNFNTIQKQLDNIYADNHQITIDIDEDGVSILLQLKLNAYKPDEPTNMIMQTEVYEH